MAIVVQVESMDHLSLGVASSSVLNIVMCVVCTALCACVWERGLSTIVVYS